MSARTAPNAARKRQIKASLIRRDGMACFYCRTPFATVADATVDHLVPQAFVPGWRLANLVLACPLCNAAKADALPQALLRPVGYGAPVPVPGCAPGYGSGCASGAGGCGMTRLCVLACALAVFARSRVPVLPGWVVPVPALTMVIVAGTLTVAATVLARVLLSRACVVPGYGAPWNDGNEDPHPCGNSAPGNGGNGGTR